MATSTLTWLLFIVLFGKCFGLNLFGFKDDGNSLICAENINEEPMKHFNLGKFLGEWYEVRNYGDDGYDRKGACAKITFKYENKNIKIINTRTITRTKTNTYTQKYDPIYARQDEGNVVFKETEGLIQDNAKIVFEYTAGSEIMQNNDEEIRDSRNYKLNTKEFIEVVHTDYERIAIVHGCSKGMFGGKNKYGWLLSRVPENHMDEKEKTELFKAFEDHLEKMNHKKVAKDYPNRYINNNCFKNYDKSKKPTPPWKDFLGELKIKD